jgi:hypothetical protein
MQQRWFYEPVPVDALSPSLALTAGCDPAMDGDAIASQGLSSEAAATGIGVLVSHSVVPAADGLLLDPGSRDDERHPGPSYNPLQYRGPVSARFTITVLYPGGERLSHPYLVFNGMPVSFLRYNLACLLRVDLPVSLFVGPTWSILAHEGAITDRVFPGTSVPCPYVVQGSEVRVQVVVVPLLLDSLVLLSVPLLEDRSQSELPPPPFLPTGRAIALADLRYGIVQRQVDAMNVVSVEGTLSPRDLVSGSDPVAPREPSLVVSSPCSDSAPTGTGEQDWGAHVPLPLARGARVTMPLSWGRADPPPHPDEGIEWSNSADQGVRAAWDRERGSFIAEMDTPSATPGNRGRLRLRSRGRFIL